MGKESDELLYTISVTRYGPRKWLIKVSSREMIR